MSAARPICLLPLLISSCQSDALFESNGGRIDLLLLPGGQLEIAGKRMSRGEFLLDLRRQVRALGDERDAPLVAVRADRSVPATDVDLLLRELRNAGIWRVNLGS